MKGEFMSLKPIECLYNLAINFKKKKKKSLSYNTDCFEHLIGWRMSQFKVI